jgi:thioesterase domain-containing protein
VTDRTDLTRELTATWRRDIPLAAAMGIEARAYDGDTLTVVAPLDPNRNLHGTGFAGSLFSVCVLTGWGATWLALRERELMGVIVVADGQITYRKAVSEALVCRCAPDGAALVEALERYRAKQRTKLPLTCTIEHAGRPAVVFTGTYVVQGGSSGH